jgi:hypothetical protein
MRVYGGVMKRPKNCLISPLRVFHHPLLIVCKNLAKICSSCRNAQVF